VRVQAPDAAAVKAELVRAAVEQRRTGPAAGDGIVNMEARLRTAVVLTGSVGGQQSSMLSLEPATVR
jgi:hypothetical protein